MPRKPSNKSAKPPSPPPENEIGEDIRRRLKTARLLYPTVEEEAVHAFGRLVFCDGREAVGLNQIMLGGVLLTDQQLGAGDFVARDFDVILIPRSPRRISVANRGARIDQLMLTLGDETAWQEEPRPAPSKNGKR